MSSLDLQFSQEIMVKSARLRLFTNSSSKINWFFIPGGPGLSSDYFLELVKNLNINGNVWLVDFPDQPILSTQNPQKIYKKWQNSLIKIAKDFSHPVFVGHSFGGMIILQTPKLKKLLSGVVLFSTSPDSTFPDLKETDEVRVASEIYYQNNSADNYKKLIISYSPIYFVNSSIGESFFNKVQFFPHADTISGWFFNQYKYLWVPKSNMSLILQGDKDQIQPIQLYEKFDDFSLLLERAVIIKNAGHFPWVENLKDTKGVLENFSDTLVFSE